MAKQGKWSKPPTPSGSGTGNTPGKEPDGEETITIPAREYLNLTCLSAAVAYAEDEVEGGNDTVSVIGQWVLGKVRQYQNNCMRQGDGK